jgi:hypothetical protein
MNLLTSESSVSAMFDISDIPDWAFYEGTGGVTDFKKTPTGEQRQCMFASSPMSRVNEVRGSLSLII